MNNVNDLMPYNFSPIYVSEPSKVEVDSRCNSLIFINTGTTIATVNGITLYPGVPGTSNGESLSIPGNKGEKFFGRIDVNFPSGPGSVTIIQKSYVEL
jgi:hypothetical protein